MINPPIPMNRPGHQYMLLKDKLDAAVLEVMQKGHYINGPEVALFASQLASYLEVDHVITCGNGTDALQLALMALNLNPGDEVITSSFSFFATAEVITLLGLVPVFADINPDTYNLDPGSVELLITPRTRCILAVHLFGLAADMEQLGSIANRHDLFLIEDAAQALGGTFRMDGKTRKLGAIGHIGCTSFFPTKNLGCFGDGGAVMTNDSRLALHGANGQYIHGRIGMNSRLDTLQAAILNVKLPYLDAFINDRQNIGNLYIKGLLGVEGISVPENQLGADHSYNQFTIRVYNGFRDQLKNILAEKGIASRIYYPLPLHLQPAMASYGFTKGICPNSENVCGEVLSLPVFPGLEPKHIEWITTTIRLFFKEKQR